MNISEQYKEIKLKISENLPIKAFPTRELVQIFRNNRHPISVKTELIITRVHNSGDISGIMCTVELADG